MSRRARRTHTPAFKAKVALAAIKGEMTLAQLARPPEPDHAVEGAASGIGCQCVRARRPGNNPACRRRETAACQDRRADAVERFLRNGARCRLHRLENKPECFGVSMQIIDDPGAIACFVERRAGVDHSVTHGVVEQNCDLARRGGHRLGFADAAESRL
jgi:hypothetical protein